MKLVSTLPERPGLLHAVPVLDVFALLILIFVLGPSLLLQSGISVEVPPSRFQLDRYHDTVVVTLSPSGENKARIHIGRDEVSTPVLSERLEQLKDQGAADTTMVLLQTEPSTPAGTEREISELILAKGFRLALVGEGTEPPAPLTPARPEANDDESSP